VIPLLGKAAAEVPAPSWPKITQDEFATLMQRIAARAEVLRVNLLTHFVPNWFTRQLAAAVAKKLLSDRLAKLSSSIQSDLKQRDQI
jgi:chromosomal replication initiation ATPase DnaA